MAAVEIEFARPADAAEIAKLLSRGFSSEVAQLLIYGCEGASEHIRMLIASGIPNVDSAYFVARPLGGSTVSSPIGAVELRRQPGGLFLNYIGVHPDYSGKRAGTSLLSAAVRMTGVSRGQIALDVLSDNTRALRWYTRLGFSIKTSAELVEVMSPPGGEDGPAYIKGLPQADLCQERFGFSSFHVATVDGTFSVGRLGEKWFRLTDMEAVGNPTVFAALRLLDPLRKIFAVLPASLAPPAQIVRRLATTHRMEAEISTVMDSLSRD